MSIVAEDFKNYEVEECCEEVNRALPYLFIEPVLDEALIDVIKLACDFLKQNIQVFCSAVDVAEQYLIEKEKNKGEIKDISLSVITSIFITSKFLGGEATLTIGTITKFIRQMTFKNYNSEAVEQAEQDILAVLSFKIPHPTLLDDFNEFFEKIIINYQCSFRKFCILLLIHSYGTKQKWLRHLKSVYRSKNKISYKILTHLLGNKYYLPAGVVMSAFKLAHYDNIDIKAILETFTKIDPDHILVLSEAIMKEYSNEE